MAFLYQLAVERGDEREAAHLEAQLNPSDVSFGGVLWFRVALAMRRAAAADFSGAAALFDGIESHLTDPNERTCRHATAAMFLALAGDADGAREHLALAIPDDSRPQNAVGARLARIARIYAGFAEIFLGRASANRFAPAVRRDEAALAAAGLELARLGSGVETEPVEPIAEKLERAGQAGFAALIRASAVRTAPARERFHLTPTEIRVLRDAASGMSPKQIAGASGRSVETVRNQLKAAIRKLGASGRLAAIAIARDAGIV